MPPRRAAHVSTGLPAPVHMHDTVQVTPPPKEARVVLRYHDLDRAEQSVIADRSSHAHRLDRLRDISRDLSLCNSEYMFNICVSQRAAFIERIRGPGAYSGHRCRSSPTPPAHASERDTSKRTFRERYCTAVRIASTPATGGFSGYCLRRSCA